MSGDNFSSEVADSWETEYLAATAELRLELCAETEVKICLAIIERWKTRYQPNKRLLHAVLNHAHDLQEAYRTGTGVTVIVNQINQGDGSNIQMGDGNSYTNVNVTSHTKTLSSDSAQLKRVDRPFPGLALAIACVAGCVAAWWFMPQSWALGQARLLVTVFVVTVAVVLGGQNWMKYQRSVWEKKAYIALAIAVLIRLSLSTLIAFNAKFKTEDSILAKIELYIGGSNPWLDALQLICVVALAVLASRTKPIAEN